MLPYNKNLKDFSRKLRKNMTDAEHALWLKLRGKQILNAQFYRQKPIAGYIVDFYCATASLIIELDGSQHLEQQNQINDIERDKLMNELGLQVLRFDNRQVLTEIDTVTAVIFDVVEKRIVIKK